eukprot:scaffold71225_cov38-Cyclotella_meneghiniana.AAC.7
MEIELAAYAQTLEIIDAVLMEHEEKVTEEQDATERTPPSETVLPPDNCIIAVSACFDSMPTLSLCDSVGGTVAEVMPLENAHLPASVASGTRVVSINVPGHANGYELLRKLNEHYTRICHLSKTGHYFEEMRELARQCSCSDRPNTLIRWCLDPRNRNQYDHIHQSIFLSLKRCKKKGVRLESGVIFAMMELMNHQTDVYEKAFIRNHMNKKQS